MSTTLAWERAVKSLKKSLPPKDLKRLQLPVRPEDLVQHVETLFDVMGQTVSRIQRFSGCVDQLAQGSPAPATLLWGSIKFVLTIIQDVSEEYDKVCRALAAILDSLPRVDIYADAFSQSNLVQQGVHDLFASVLHFWVKACKFYRRRAIWNFMRSTWSDYNSESSCLETSITGAVDRIEKGGLAEHIKDSRTFMSEQRQTNDTQDIRSKEQSNLNRIFAPLLPPNEDMNYYTRDHETARQNRHPCTCEWILHHPKFVRWSQIPEGKGGQLWINGGPGFGKTVLTSFIIDHYRDSETRHGQPVLLYFYFRDSSLQHNNATAATCSMAYQLHGQQEEHRGGIEMNANIINRTAEDNGKSSFPEVWRRLSMFLDGRSNIILILDALDECEDNGLFLPKLLDLAVSKNIQLLMTSRRQKLLVRYLENVETLEITPGDVHHDIKAFVEFKVARNPRLSHPLVRDIVKESLLNEHNGMFLWVNLMLKELKACISVEEVQTTLMQVPSGLEGIYTKIVRRLEESLTRRAAELTRNILTWVLGSARTLSMDELREALCFQYQAQGHTLLSDGEFPYADKDIENMCGSLVSIRHGQIQTVHQSTKEYLVELGEDRRLCQGLAILPTSVDTSLELASICLRYQEKLCKSSLMKLQMSPFSHHPEGFDIRMLQANSKLLDYSFLFWIRHVVSCPTSHRESLVALILKHFSKFMTVFWMVISMSLDSRGLWRLVIGVEEVEEWLLEGTSRENMGDAARHLQDWCSSITKLFKGYSTVLLENPWIIWRLDLKGFLGQEQPFAAPSNCIDKSEESEECLRSAGQANGLQARSKIPILGHNRRLLLKARLGFFVHERNQNIFLIGESNTSGEECLFVRHAESGKRLSPATAGLAAVHVDEKYHYGFVVTAKVSAQGKYLAVAYNKWLSLWSIKPNLKFSHRLRDRAWAFRLIAEAYREGSPEHITAGMIAFEGDDRLFAPRGWYDLATKEFHAFPSMLLDKLRTADSICYSGNCSYLFTERQRESSQEVSRHSLSLIGLADTVSTAFDVASMRNIKSSNTGNYFLLFDDKPNYKDTSPSSIALFNMATMEMERFPGTENFSSFGECSFHFLEGDDTLVTFLWEPETRRGVHAIMTVTVWGLGPGQPKLCSQGHNQHGSRDLAWIVFCDRTVQIVKFTSDEISFPGYDPSANEPSMLYSRVSQDGRRLGNIRIMGSKIHLEVINLLPSLQEGFKLEKVFPKTERVHPMCLSPNLDLLVVECDIDLVTPARDCDWACTISSCGEFVAFDKPAYKHYLDYFDRQLGRSVIFRINRTVRMATPLTIPCPKDVQAASPDFHPLLPLAAFSSSEGEGRDNNSTDPRRPQVPANEITLSMIHLIEDRLVPLKPLQMTHRVCPKLYVADTGDFLLLEDWNAKSRIIVSDLPYQSKPLCVIRNNRHIHPSKDRSYMLQCEQNSVEITMYKYQDLAKNSVLPAYQALGSTATVESLTVFPSTLGWPEVWLLLGEDYSNPMRMLLLQPSKGELPVMKTLMASWDQLRERLEATLTPV